jgi:hypothetical protein
MIYQFVMTKVEHNISFWSYDVYPENMKTIWNVNSCYAVVKISVLFILYFVDLSRQYN